MKKQQKGFTIIEVVLVLAIAGLIFLMVFIALPALQRGQRDGQRRQDASRFLSQINSYSTNNRGDVPAANANKMVSGKKSFANEYLKRSAGEFKDPQTGDDYNFRYGTASDMKGDTKTFVYATGAKCDGERIVDNSGASRSVAVQIKLEGSGYFCEDNQ